METIPCTLLGLTVKSVGCHTALNGDGAPNPWEIVFFCCLGPDHQPEPCNLPCSAAGPGNQAGLTQTYSFSGKQKGLTIVLIFQAGKWHTRKQSQWWEPSEKQEPEAGTAQNPPLRALPTHNSPLSYSFDTELPNPAP